MLHAVTYGNGAGIEYTYDEANRLRTIDHRDAGGLTMLKLTYDYDRRDLPTFITEDRFDGSTIVVEFEYDNRGRLYHESRDGATPYDLWYSYDQGGNRLTKRDALDETETVYHYDLDDPDLYGSANNRLVYSETYDLSGREATPLPSPLRKGGLEGGESGRDGVLLSTTWYYYNGVGNVTRVVTHPEGTDDYSATRLVYAVNGSAVSYVTGETWTWDGVAPWPDNYDITYAREFRYDGARQRYLNRELDTDQLQEYGLLVSVSETWSDYDGNSIYGDFTIDGSTVTDIRSFEPGIARSSAPGNPLATEYYHNDHLGTTRLLSDNTSAAITPATYTAFGELVDGENHRYGYAGAWGYHSHGVFPYLHVGHRYYDPSTGRFLQRDPIGIRGGLNSYEYVASAPTIGVDPRGLTWWRGLLPSMGKGARWGPIGVCGGIAYWYTTDIIKPAIDRRNRRIDRQGNPDFRQPFDPNDPWGWVPPGSSWNKQRIEWEEEHRPPRPEPSRPPEVPCGPHY